MKVQSQDTKFSKGKSGTIDEWIKRNLQTFIQKKGSLDARKTHSEEARDSSNEPISGAKVQNNSDTAKGLSGKIREYRTFHGSVADFKKFDQNS